jgi:MFS family permease
MWGFMPENKSCSEYLDTRVTASQNLLQPRLTRRVAYVLLAAVFAYGMLGTTITTPLYAIYQQKYALTSLLITIIFTVYALGVLLALVFFGRVSDHFGRRPILTTALIIAATSTLLFIFAQSVSVLLLARFISGLGAGLLTGTATAALAELEPTCSPQRAARVATAANMGGLGLGPLIAGLFAQLAPDPTQLVFIVYLVFVFVCIGLVGFLPETVRSPDRKFNAKPRVGVASSTHGVFVQSAVTVFSVFAILGLFSALSASFLRETLKQPNLLVDGIVVFLLFSIATVAQVGMSRLTSRTARVAGIVTLLVALTFIELGLSLPSLSLFLAGTVIGGLGIGLAFMGSLAAINQVAPPNRRGEMVSAFFVAAYVGLTVPVVGVGFLIDATNFVVGTIILSVALVLLLLATLMVLLLSSRKKMNRT